MTNQLTKSETKYLKPFVQKYILLPTKFKKPLVKNWNKYYPEHRSIEQLLTLNQEYSLRTGTKISQHYYFIALDLDDLWAKERIKVSRYVETARGIHRYIWIKELPKSCWLVNQNGDPIGELHSKGRFIVGIGSIHESGVRYTLKGKNSLKWSLRFESLQELQEFLKERNIFTTPWGKKGLANVRDLELYKKKEPKPKSPSKEFQYFQKREKLENKVNQHPKKDKLNICYICLVYFPKEAEIIKAHLSGKNHQKNWKSYQAKKPKTFPQNRLVSGKIK